MSAKERFLKKLQATQPRSGTYDNKAQADIAEFCLRMGQLQENMDGWLEGTGIRIESTSVSLVEFLTGGRAFHVPGIHLHYESRKVTFTPVFLYGQGVTGCVEVSLCVAGSVNPLCRLFMRAGGSCDWTWRLAGNSTSPGGAFSEEAFFGMVEGLLP